MNKLFAFGCSITYGHGLEDCFKPHDNGAGPVPSKLAWPSALASMLNREVVNLSMPGSSNKAIVHQLSIHRDQIRKGDVVAIHWSYIERHMIVQEGGYRDIKACKHIGPWMKDKLSKIYYKHIWGKQDDSIISAWYIDYADLILKNAGIKVIHCLPPNSGKSVDFQLIQLQHYIKTHDSLSNHVVDKALDDNHPGPVSHNHFAKMIYQKYGDYLK